MPAILILLASCLLFSVTKPTKTDDQESKQESYVQNERFFITQCDEKKPIEKQHNANET